MRKNYDGRKIKWLDTFCFKLETSIRSRAPRIDGREIKLRLVFATLLGELMSEEWDTGPNGGKLCATGLVADNVGESYSTTRRMMMKMSKMGLVACVSSWQSNRKRAPNEVFINPDLMTAYSSSVPLSKLIPMINKLADMYIERRDTNVHVQGFSQESQVEFGEYNQTLKQGATKASDLLGKIKAENDEKAVEARRKREDNNQWRNLGKDFIGACADYWVAQRGKQGFGSGRPSWEGDPKDLDSTSKRQNADLRKLFERFGGKRVGMAWMIFCASQPEIDALGKRAMDMDSGYKQFTSPDKRPDQFAKYFDQICGTRFYQQFIKENEKLVKLEDYFGILSQVQPRGNQQPSTLKQEAPTDEQPRTASKTPIPPTTFGRDTSVPF